MSFSVFGVGNSPPGGGANGENADRIAAVIAQSANYTEPTAFTLQRPADPTGTLTDEAPSSIAAIQSTCTTSSRRVTIAPGTYTGDVTVLGDDIDVIATGVTINGNLIIGQDGTGARPSRLRWTGGTVNGRFEMAKGTDFLVDNIHVVNDFNSTGADNDWTGGRGDGVNPNRERFAFINSTIDWRNGSDMGDWAIFMGAPGLDPPPDHVDSFHDWFMGNVRLLSNAGSQHFRVHDYRRGIMVGVGWEAGGVNGPRWEAPIYEQYIVDCYGFDSTIGDATDPNPDGFQDWEIDHFIRFHTALNAFSNLFNDSSPRCTVHNSKYWHSPGNNVGTEVDIGTATGSGNIIQAWDGSTTAAHIAAEGLDWITGADH